MDGVSLAASLVGIGTAGCQIAIKLYTLATQISTASERISSISSDISLTSSVLQQLGEFLTQKVAGDDAGVFSRSGLETTKASAAVCENIFKEIEQAAKDASEQIRGKGRCTGKIKLSKLEKAKWPFLQPSIADLRTDLREAKGTLMLMLQLTSLAFSKKMAAVHRTASANIVEQKDVIRTILELSKQTHARDLTSSNPLSVDSSSGVRIAASTSVRSSPIQPNVLVAIPEQGIQNRNPNPGIRSTSRPSQPDTTEKFPLKVQNDERDLSTVSKSSQSLRGGSPYTPSGFCTDEPKKTLELFVTKAVVHDVGDVVQLSWATRRIRMQQSEIQQQVACNEHQDASPLYDLYENLYAHEHKAIENYISADDVGASLKSLKRTYADIRHREILFKGVPCLQFVLERISQMVTFPIADDDSTSQFLPTTTPYHFHYSRNESFPNPLRSPSSTLLTRRSEVEGPLEAPPSRHHIGRDGPGRHRSKMELDDHLPQKEIGRIRDPRISITESRNKAKPVALKCETPKAVDLSETSQYLQSLWKARFLRSSDDVKYPAGIAFPNPGHTLGYSGRVFRYDIEFLVQFQTIINDSRAKAEIHQSVVIPNGEALRFQYHIRTQDDGSPASGGFRSRHAELHKLAKFAAENNITWPSSDRTKGEQGAEMNLPFIGYTYKRFNSFSKTSSVYDSPERQSVDDPTTSETIVEPTKIQSQQGLIGVNDARVEEQLDDAYEVVGMGPILAVDMAPPDRDPRQRSFSPFDTYSQPSISREPSHMNKQSRRSSTSSIPNRDYILELADPTHASAMGAKDNRVQKHPATFQCTLCPKRFTRAYSLRSHLRTHTDERPFVCTVCGEAFARQHDRKRHQGLHSREKRFLGEGELDMSNKEHQAETEEDQPEEEGQSEEEEDEDDKGINDDEAEKIVKDLLGKYTTHFDS